jgi:hypothetical protein
MTCQIQSRAADGHVGAGREVASTGRTSRTQRPITETAAGPPAEADSESDRTPEGEWPVMGTGAAV